MLYVGETASIYSQQQNWILEWTHAAEHQSWDAPASQEPIG